MLRLTQRVFPVSSNRVLPVHNVLSYNPTIRTFSLLRNLRRPFDDAKRTVLSPIQSMGRLKHLPPTDKQWQALGETAPILPFGFLGSIVYPALFLGGVALAVISWANSERVKEKRKKKDRLAEYLAPMGRGNFLEDTTKMILSVFGINFVSFWFWQSPRFRYMMHNHFSYGPLNPSVISGLFSNISHRTYLHALFSVPLLISAFNDLKQYVSKEQLLAYYIAGGSISSLGSLFFRLIVRDFPPTLGPSGAICTMMAASVYLSNTLYDSWFTVFIALSAVGCFGTATRLFRSGFNVSRWCS
ncbi:hypothetical protein PROFUN_02121 [Planoprotostelium fungivorum]|uniref:Peptidase S54 rhomboid domain-containing protein n=1 Tax=Planoprotostelium fungivorum TaxID=1890364 RepID=A0A2P6NZ66_9EUKA|nr:hypothetical protein PROFUN_02121 [Planoprotostelium fungivorum]